MRPLPIVEKGGVLVIHPGQSSSFNEVEATSLREGLYAALASRPSPLVALDLSRIEYLSSTGIALLIGTKRRVDMAQGKLALFGLHPDILELFGLMKLTVLFDIAADEAEALALLTTLPTS